MIVWMEWSWRRPDCEFVGGAQSSNERLVLRERADEELLHVVLHKAHFRAVRKLNLLLPLTTAQVCRPVGINTTWCFYLQTTWSGQKSPALCQMVAWPRELEVVNVDDEEQSKSLMVVA